MKVFYSDAYVQAAHEFDTVRKSSWIAESLRDEPIPGVVVAKPAPLSAAALGDVHDRAYVDAVRTGQPRQLAESQGFAWDPGMWASVTASNGGTVAAALAALDDGVAGSLSSGLHHARRSEGRGFCTFNGLALAAAAVTRCRPGEVLIVDLDAHCGGGTASLIHGSERIRQLDIAVNGFDHYAAEPGTTWLNVVHSGDRYLDAVRDMLGSWSTSASVELVLYNAGMDPYEGCDVGGLSGITEAVLDERERIVFEWASAHGLPVAFALAGGYVGRRLSRDVLVRLHRSTIGHAADAATALKNGDSRAD